MARRNCSDAFQNPGQVEAHGKELLRDFHVLKSLVTTLSSGRTLENFHYSTLEDLKNDYIRGKEREAFLENEIRSDELKSRTAKHNISTGQQRDGANGAERKVEEMTQSELLKESMERR